MRCSPRLRLDRDLVVKGNTTVIETSRSLADASANESPEDAHFYHADPSWFEENNLSFDDVVRARMCDTCRAKVGQEVEERAPVVDKATGRLRSDARQR